jgi:hypothetical protein
MDATVYERCCHDSSQISTSIVRFSDPGMTAANSNCVTIKNATKVRLLNGQSLSDSQQLCLRRTSPMDDQAPKKAHSRTLGRERPKNSSAEISMLLNRRWSWAPETLPNALPERRRLITPHMRGISSSCDNSSFQSFLPGIDPPLLAELQSATDQVKRLVRWRECPLRTTFRSRGNEGKPI